jgi:hypothetical protein
MLSVAAVLVLVAFGSMVASLGIWVATRPRRATEPLLEPAPPPYAGRAPAQI